MTPGQDVDYLQWSDDKHGYLIIMTSHCFCLLLSKKIIGLIGELQLGSILRSAYIEKIDRKARSGSFAPLGKHKSLGPY